MNRGMVWGELGLFCLVAPPLRHPRRGIHVQELPIDSIT
jgi:hypothetical protein